MGSISPVNDAVAYSPILQNHHSKTIDIGLNGSTLSAGPLGDILQLSCFHPRHGMIVACPFAQFDGSRFHDPEYVRTYRTILLNYVRSGTEGFGIRFNGDISNLNIDFINNQWANITYTVQDFQVSTTLSISQDGGVVQSTQVSCHARTAKDLEYTLSLGMSINRASYGQLTEGGPIPIPDSTNEFQLSKSGLSWAVINSNLDAIAEGSLYCNGQVLQLNPESSETIVFDKPVSSSHRGIVQILPGQTCELVSTFRLRPEITLSKFKSSPSPLDFGSRGHWRLDNGEAGLIIKRNLEYILGNCTVPVGNKDVCFITDHVALPLGWNRDNYWQIRFLLDIHKNLDRIAYPETAHTYANQIRTAVRGHLNWVFRCAQRPHGYWHRSYLTTGVPKDGPVFQQDQQCYPLLELCDFLEAFPSEENIVREILREGVIPQILDMLKEHQDPGTGLYATDETPGDDAVEYPFHFSSHVLLWYTITRVCNLVKRMPDATKLLHSQLLNEATQLRQVILDHFVSKNPATGGTMFAYLTDGAGKHTFYHDANDIPTLFIPVWGFSTNATLHDIWSRTMKFGLSTANKGGFYPEGEFAGLGSVHTEAPWPLGYAQEFMFADLTGDIKAREDAWRRIKGSMFWDGLFPEAVDPTTGDCVSKAWFSWAGSMIGGAILPTVVASIGSQNRFQDCKI